MVILKRLSILIFIFWTSLVQGAELRCLQKNLCEFVLNHFETRFKEVNLENVLQYARENTHIKQVGQDKDGNFELDLKFDSTKVEVFSESSNTGIIDPTEFRKIVQNNETDVINNEDVNRKVVLLEGYLKARGYKDYKLSIFETKSLGIKSLFIGIRIGEALVLNKINYPDNLEVLNLQGFIKSLKRLENRPFNQLELRIVIQDIERILVKSGYLYSAVSYKQKINGSNIEIDLIIKLGPRVQFSVRGNKIFTKYEIIKQLSSSARSKINRLNTALIIETIEKIYKDRGFYFTDVKVRTITGKTNDKRTLINYYVQLVEGRKLAIKSVNFVNNIFYKTEQLNEFMFDNTSELVQNGFFDENSLINFKGFLNKNYQENGFVDFEIKGPEFVFANERNSVEVTFYLDEGEQYLIDDLKVCDCEKSFQEKVERFLVNKEKNPINIHEIDNDVKRANDFIQEQGFYYSTVKPIFERVTFDTGASTAKINFGIETGPKTIVNEIFINGLVATKDFVVKREIFLKKGDVLSPSKVKAIQQRINSLGLFKSVKVYPVKNKEISKNEQLVNITIDLEEKDFGSGEVAIGYRTDIGARSSFGLIYNNVRGRNWIWSLDTQANYRFSFSNLDRERNPEENKFVEFGGNTGFTFPYFYSVPLSTSFNVAYKQQRFYGFDAKIFRFSYNNSYTFFDKLDLNLRYQFETIDQYDASEEIDNDSFKIGSITPTISLDLRDRPIAPRYGAFFSLSWEFANPSLFAQDSDELTINYNRLVFRNKFYVPFSEKVVWATSYSTGVATNFSNQVRTDENGDPLTYDDGQIVTTGYIPSIRVFRLDAQDTVRGFTDSEINKLDTGEDIGEVIVNDRVYFSVIKTEFRYSINDSLRAGLFFDAGSIRVNSYQPGKFRTSTGITTKFVTPVGSLDLDFGVKTRRRRFEGGLREEFGRLHFSIGFF